MHDHKIASPHFFSVKIYGNRFDDWAIVDVDNGGARDWVSGHARRALNGVWYLVAKQTFQAIGAKSVPAR